MMVMYPFICLGLILIRESRNVQSFPKHSKELFSTRRPSSGLSSQSSHDSSYSLCGSTNSVDAHTACHKECLAIRSKVSFIYKRHPDNGAIKYLHKYCGKITEGKCGTGSYFSTCWCSTPNALKGQQKASLFICRFSLLMLRMFAHSGTSANSGISNPISETISKNEAPRCRETVEKVGMHRFFPDNPERRRSARTRPNTRPGIRSPSRPGTSRHPVSSAPITPSARASLPPFTPSASSSFRPFVPYPTSSRPAVPSLPPGFRPVTPYTPGSVANAPFTSSSFHYGSSSHTSAQQQEEDDWNTKPDGEPEGDMLWTVVRVAKLFIVHALLDTGSGFTMIHKKLRNNFIPMHNRVFIGANNQAHPLHGQTTINVEFRKGFNMPVTGYVTDHKHEILLGTDFFLEYSAYIRIEERTMKLSKHQVQVNAMLRFRFLPDELSMMNSDPATFTSLGISVLLNRRETRIEIDTGAGLSIVNRNFVNLQTLQSTNAECSVSGGAPILFLGSTEITIGIGSNMLKFAPALVPQDVLARDFIGGNDFIKQHVDRIDYESRYVTLKFPNTQGYTRITTKALLTWGQLT